MVFCGFGLTMHPSGEKASVRFKPPVPDLDMRQKVWEYLVDEYTRNKPPSCGPFEVTLHMDVKMMFEHFITGKDGEKIARVNDQLIPGHLLVSWGCGDDGKPDRLILGYSKLMARESIMKEKPHTALSTNLLVLWRDVVRWMDGFDRGTKVPLVTQLEFNLQAQGSADLVAFEKSKIRFKYIFEHALPGEQNDAEGGSDMDFDFE